jgi:hypothetical protein
MDVKDWRRALGGLFGAKARRESDDAVTQARAQSAWKEFVTRAVIPAFEQLKSTPGEYCDGTSMVIEQGATGEHWLRLTSSVAPSPSLIASLPPGVQAQARARASARIVLTYTITADAPSEDTQAWSETRVPNPTSDASERMRLFREELGDYRRKDLTKDAIRANFLSNYQRHVLGATN